MARWKSNNKRHRKRHAFSKRKERAIKAIAKGEIETKHFWRQVPSYSASGANADYGRYFNIFANVPKDQAGADSEENVIGNTFDARGVKFVISTVSSVDYEVIYRATVLSCNDYFYDTAGTVLSAGNGIFYEQEYSAFLPRKRYNIQSVNILHSETWSNKKLYSTQAADEAFKTFFVPIKGKKHSKAEEEVDATVNELKGKQYYLLVEQYIAGAPASPPNASIGTSVAWCVYWKDA